MIGEARMIRFIKKRLSYANIAVTAALVFAMAGGAFAASGGHASSAKHKHKHKDYVITSTTQVSPKVLKALKGNVGPAGPVGEKGAAGEKGAQGAPGKDGTNGTNGADGVSVTGVTASPAECAAGGVKYTSASGSSAVCNGKEGSPWTAGGTLPSKKSETGTWISTSATKGNVDAAVGFPLRLEAALEEGEVHYILRNGKESKINLTNGKFEEVAQSACPGSAVEPSAEPGNLCVYESFSHGIVEEGTTPVVFIEKTGSAISNPITSPGIGAGTTGAVLFMVQQVSSSGPEEPEAYGTWAVTAPEV